MFENECRYDPKILNQLSSCIKQEIHLTNDSKSSDVTVSVKPTKLQHASMHRKSYCHVGLDYW